MDNEKTYSTKNIKNWARHREVLVADAVKGEAHPVAEHEAQADELEAQADGK